MIWVKLDYLLVDRGLSVQGFAEAVGITAAKCLGVDEWPGQGHAFLHPGGDVPGARLPARRDP